MSKNLVIVESPAKAKTIEKFLGADYVVKSSIGHIRDMPKKDMGVNIENDFQPTYAISADKKKVVADLKKSAKTAEKIYLATDEDREGEAIAWHLQQALSLAEDTPRIVFHEITKGAITDAISNPRTINTDLVNAQQARRIIDRLVGFEISPVLWRKISGARSAGRVQSPVVRLVVEREREISAHSPVSTYKVKANLVNKTSQSLEVKLGKDFDSREEALAFAEALLKSTLIVESIDTKPSKRSPKAPFITSTLQQEASQKLGFSVKQTMSIAQNLYREGAITYMRTDSLNLSEVAISAAQDEIISKYGKDFHQARRYKTSSTGAQEAHEAIRPTDLTKPTILGLDDQSAKLYSLIYKRTLASQMSDAQLQKTKINISISERSENFIADGEILSFAGFLEVYDYIAAEDKLLPEVSKGDELTLMDMSSRESFSRAKPRYTEASLVKEIEQMGIGRPSTFATMITTVQDRNYVVKDTREGAQREYQMIEIADGVISQLTQTENTGAEKNKLFPTNVAYLLVDFLVKNFRNIIGYEFTANLESDFDLIAEESKPWAGVIRNFYEPFHEQIELAKDISRDETHGKRDLGEDPVSGKPVSVRFGRYGAYAQIGTQDDEEKPTFASLRTGQDIENISLDEAIELFKMPRTVGETDGGEVIKANYGRFGPYIQYGKKYVSLKEVSPEEVSLETALELIAAKEKFDAERIIKVFEDSEIQVLNGRFGPYIWNGKKRGKGQKNVTVQKVFGDKEPADLSLEECKKAIEGKIKAKKAKAKKSKKKAPAKKKASS
ncbi:DNA topoisomerase I [Candidatus Pseudothioglobus singularis]|jgi:DNA topoisomerase-1|uniref:DNA topoisomerase 1 n=1 Tax=Candidatus Pseudothioglobus singularis PS1 TaxID=1125411 RepID=A0A0M5KRH8_9GAMM|nr:type I DNA topoisomerase [Candidatus Pseudothioglobus singularis]ALE01190.1 DNA topoisomerase I [Candidatus Pseudothioglobus singularis PS1]ANQ65836.1 DNA topoisomerase I [Candidatus Pseudothioglobus singularis]MDB4847837.1 type I DNA topoisomerase [Candidatus Pseudothioglobus singularis]MDC0648316.1 type I DNA topoisomerase [Candidatus Pseudothioglobus singularis]